MAFCYAVHMQKKGWITQDREDYTKYIMIRINHIIYGKLKRDQKELDYKEQTTD
jgi:hypothetical protein